MRFTKMEGTGNDYIYINGFEEAVDDPATLSMRMSREHFGCGADGLILILPSDQADFRMRMFNKDGSEGEMCGNGIRCVAKYCYDRKLTSKTDMTIESGGQVKHIRCFLENGAVQRVRVDMGVPLLDGKEIPSTLEGSPILRRPVKVQGQTYAVTLVNVGNPHAIILVDDVASAPVLTAGPLLSSHPFFPNKINVEFVQVVNRARIIMRVWERGTGETLACGTGATAALVACVLNKLTQRAADVVLLGGTLRIEWDEEDHHIYMTGSANFVYDGEWLA